MRFTSHSGSTPPSGIASGLASLPNGLPSNPTRFCDLPYTDTLLSSPGNPIVLLPCCFPSPRARTLCTLFGRNRHGAHGPCSKRIYSSTCTLPSPHLDLLSYGLGKPSFVLVTYANKHLSYGLVIAPLTLCRRRVLCPRLRRHRPPPPLSPSAVSSFVSTTLGNPIVLVSLLFSVAVRTDHLYIVWLQPLPCAQTTSCSI